MKLKQPLVWAIGLALCVACVCPQLHAVEEVVELRLQAVKALKGVVLYPNGEAVSGAKVAELTSDWKTELRATSTDSQGHFILASVKGRKVYYLQVTVPGAAGVNPLRMPLKVSRVWGKGLLRLRLELA
ncbi:MAG TPA: carboxypeptidase-like regulatory domain-containing protein [Candidatus Sulfotelmatobacter sp.]|nr:carboxypeptidase-like regulatory domain-containing protein [Candidatus Sulfotelmatobacter sp.]